jgi:hypothetical protein
MYQTILLKFTSNYSTTNKLKEVNMPAKRKNSRKKATGKKGANPSLKLVLDRLDKIDQQFERLDKIEAELKTVREETAAGFGKMEKRTEAGLKAVRKETTEGFSKIERHTTAEFKSVRSD